MGMILQRKKQALTLLEIMIVILLIGLIGSVIGYNMKGSLEEGKSFKTSQTIDKLHDILTLEMAKGFSLEEVVQDPSRFLQDSGLVKDPKKMLVDGWGQKLDIQPNQHCTDIVIKSKMHEDYLARKKTHLRKRSRDGEAELSSD
jgi:competence protein ComGC